MSFNRDDRRSTTYDVATSFRVFHCLWARDLQTPFLSIPSGYLPISYSVFLSFLPFHCLLQNCLCQDRGSRDVAISSVSVSSPWLGDQQALQLHSGFCCDPPHLSHGLCRKCSEASFNISSQGIGSISEVLLLRTSSQRHKGRRPQCFCPSIWSSAWKKLLLSGLSWKNLGFWSWSSPLLLASKLLSWSLYGSHLGYLSSLSSCLDQSLIFGCVK